MAEERLSRLQRIILKHLYNTKILTEEDKEEIWMKNLGLIQAVGEETGKASYHPFFGRDVDPSFKSTFSQSLRNLAAKGMIELWKGRRRVIGIRITEKGENALTLTCKLRIREEIKALQARVENLLEGKGQGIGE